MNSPQIGPGFISPQQASFKFLSQNVTVRKMKDKGRLKDLFTSCFMNEEQSAVGHGKEHN